MARLMKIIASFIRPRRHSVFAFIIFALCCSCEPGYDDLLTSSREFPVSIFAFLNTAADSQYVILHNNTPPAGAYGDLLETEYKLLRQAEVTLMGPYGRVAFQDRYELISPFHEDFEHDFVFVTAQRVRPGENYSLRVEIPQKGSYTAGTAVPGDFQMLSPQNLDTVAVFDSLTVNWTAAENAAGYRVSLRRNAFDIQYWYVPSLSHPSLRLKHNFPQANSRDSTLVNTTLSIDALDAPSWLAHRINQRGGFEFEKELRTMPGTYSNIAGGLGLMSAVTSRTIPLTLLLRKK